MFLSPFTKGTAFFVSSNGFNQIYLKSFLKPKLPLRRSVSFHSDFAHVAVVFYLYSGKRKTSRPHKHTQRTNDSVVGKKTRWLPQNCIRFNRDRGDVDVDGVRHVICLIHWWSFDVWNDKTIMQPSPSFFVNSSRCCPPCSLSLLDNNNIIVNNRTSFLRRRRRRRRRTPDDDDDDDDI